MSPIKTENGDISMHESWDQHSEAGGTSTSSAWSTPTELHFWYGKKAFTQMMRQRVFATSSSDDSVATIDSRTDVLIQEFPYHDAVTLLQREHSELFSTGRLPASIDTKRLLMNLVGHTERFGTKEEREALMSTISSLAGAGYQTPPNNPTKKPFSQSEASSQFPFNPFMQVSPDRGEKNGYYTLMLKERADQRGIPLDYKIERSPYDPETFKAELIYRGKRYEGIGKTKQQAKHQASKNACSYLESQSQ